MLAYDIGLVAACGICLPVFYFFGLLAGVEVSMVRVVGYSLKGLATTGVVLPGILPLYVTPALVPGITSVDGNLLSIGLTLPFVVEL